MKKNLLLITMIAMVSFFIANGQSTLIIDEDFQDWDASQEIVAPDSCEAGYEHLPDLTGTLEITTSSGTEDLTVTMLKCAISPECDSKKTPAEGITTGYVSLNKISGITSSELTIEDYGTDTDTLGQFIFGPVPQIDSIVFAHSATGSNRGIRVFKSVDGEDWENVSSDNEFWDGDSQNGVIDAVEINESDIYIKFTSGFKQSDNTSQISRLHHLKVYGVPGELPEGVSKINKNHLKIYQLQGTSLFKIEGRFNSVKVYNTIGSVIHAEYSKGSQTIDLLNAPKGIYIVRAIDNYGKDYIQKIIKQ